MRLARLMTGKNIGKRGRKFSRIPDKQLNISVRRSNLKENMSGFLPDLANWALRGGAGGDNARQTHDEWYVHRALVEHHFGLHVVVAWGWGDECWD